jgi:transposase
MDDLKVPEDIYDSQAELENTPFPFRKWIDTFKNMGQTLSSCFPDKVEIIFRAQLQVIDNFILEYQKDKLVKFKMKKTKNLNTLLESDNIDINQLGLSMIQFTNGQLTEKIFKPFWSSNCLKQSSRIWLPKLDYTEKLNRLDCPILQSYLPKLSCNPQQPRKPKRKNSKPVKNLRTIKLRLYPDNRQKNIMMEWMHTRRYLYNKAIEMTRKGANTKQLINTLTTKRTDDSDFERCTILKEDGEVCNRKYRAWRGCSIPGHSKIQYKIDPSLPNIHVPSWVMNTPQTIRKGAIRDLDKARNECISRLKEGTLHRFNLNFCSKKKCNTPSLEICPDSTPIKIEDGKLLFFPNYKDRKSVKFGAIKLSKRQLHRDNQRLEFNNTCRLKLHNGAWYLMVPSLLREKKIVPTKSVCALDPGVRTFQTLYSPEGIVKFQQNMKHIDKLHSKIDELKSLRTKNMSHKIGTKYRREYKRIYRRLGWLIDELHYSTIHELKQYRHILLPRFDSQEMVQSRKLDKKTKRRMMALQHFRFKQRLEDMVNLHTDSKLYIVNETYTTKTCTQCGVLNDVGSNSIYHCLDCGLQIERDINGARNILLKYLNQI